jgi:hypothetical protein
MKCYHIRGLVRRMQCIPCYGRVGGAGPAFSKLFVFVYTCRFRVDPGTAFAPEISPEQWQKMIECLVGPNVDTLHESCNGFMYGFLMFGCWNAIQRGDHLRKARLCMGSVINYRPDEFCLLTGDQPMKVLVLSLMFSKTSNGRRLDPVPFARHRDVLRCAVSWLAMYLFHRFFLVGSHGQSSHGMVTLPGQGLPDLLGGTSWLQDHVSSIFVLVVWSYQVV